MKPSLSASPAATAWNASSSGCSDLGEIGGALVGALHQEIEHESVAHPAVVRLERDAVGVLGDHLEAEILEDRQRHRKRQRRPQAVELDAQNAVRVVRLAQNARLDRGRFGRARQRPQGGEVLHRLGRREGVAIARGKALRLIVKQVQPFDFAVARAQRFGEAVVPGADGGADFALPARATSTDGRGPSLRATR